MKKDIHSEAVEKLFTAVMSLKNMEECYLFFEDICTVNELLSLSQRFDVGSRLLEKQTYQEISEATGASTATISISPLPRREMIPWAVTSPMTRCG